VILRDFPKLLWERHFTLCDSIPPTCIQLRNLILCAFPHALVLPDPISPDLDIDTLPEMRRNPSIRADVSRSLVLHELLKPLEACLMTRDSPAFMNLLFSKLVLSDHDALAAGTRYNVPLINSLVLTLGMDAIASLESSVQNSEQSIASVFHAHFSASPHADIFIALVRELPSEGRYHVLNSIANQLRFPNTHTHYFCALIKHLFNESPHEEINEQITRVIVERVIAHRPHPWGVLITFIQLIKLPRFDASRPFMQCAPEIKELLHSLIQSCTPHPAQTTAS
jgi:CCR4-NOT transcription complex subunit 1